MRRLLIRPGAIGDLITSLPALESLCADCTEVWVAAACVPLIRFAPARSIRSTGLDWLEIRPDAAPPGLIETLRSFDSIVSWYGAQRDEFRAAVQAFGLPFTFLLALPVNAEPDRTQHAVDFYLEQAASLRGWPLTALPRIDCSSVGMTDPAQLPRAPDVVIHPFSGSPRKNWPLGQFRKLATCLAKTWTVGWTAGPEEPLAEATRFEDLYALAGWLATARIFVGNDSGIAHLAAAVGVPVVAIFGPTDDRVWAPRGPVVRIVRPPSRPAPIDDVALGDVLASVEGILISDRTVSRPTTSATGAATFRDR